VPVAGRAPWLVVEDTHHPHTSLEDKASKRRKTDDSTRALLNFNTGSRSVDQKMVERFMVAMECWDFLQSNVTYQQEFMRLSQQWGALEWSWLGMFRADMAVYKCDHTQAMQILTHEWHKVKEENKRSPMATRFIMQMVNCTMVLGDSKGACSFASEVISLMPSSQALPGVSSGLRGSPSLPPHNTGRQLRLLSCTLDEVMPFCMEVITRTLKDVAFSDPKNDRALGQLLVLLQYQWPKEENIFASLITTVQKRRRFHFPEFFEYVILIDILEEMLFLSNCDSLQITLLPQSDVNKVRTVTRGVNRGAREELMYAMEQQIRRCDEPVEPLLRKFFQQEKLSLGGKHATA
jgi:integrator complex subunit 10